MIRAAIVTLLALSMSCATERGQTGFENLDLETVEPGLLVPGTEISATGQAFVEQTWGTMYLRIAAQSGGKPLARIRATYKDAQNLSAIVESDTIEALGADTLFEGFVSLEIESHVDGRLYQSAALPVVWDLRTELTPALDKVDAEPLMFVNDLIEIGGTDFLLGGQEGQARALVDGCFIAQGTHDCIDVERQEVELSVGRDRKHANFPFVPAIAGIGEGIFQGQVTIKNAHRGARVLASRPVALRIELSRPMALAFTPGQVSVSQYVEIQGGGFVGGKHGGSTLLELSGSIERDSGATFDVKSVTLVPKFVSGRVQRYVMSEDDAFGKAVKLRGTRGEFRGTLRPITYFQGQEMRGDAVQVSFELSPVKQLVYVVFLPSYVHSLRHFGLGAVDQEIRRRVIDVIERDYATINLEVRTERPTDFAHYSELEIAGRDVNGVGLLGYDNTPGKDSGNRRLFDKIGGGNASTQDDGFAGFGGVFIESLFAFSTHPMAPTRRAQNADSAFDRIFDPFRPDQRGHPVIGKDLYGMDELQLLDSKDCPSRDRAQQIRCAIWVMGNLIGTTASHEIGHSIGLANPHGSGFHNPGDQPNRLMDAGGNRPFAERAELFEQGPAKICDGEYEYLREIMPGPEETDSSERPNCF